MTSVAAKGAGTKSAVVPSRAVDMLDPDASISARIAAVMSDCRMVAKSGVNERQGYAFAPEGELVDMLRPLMGAAGLVLHAEVEQVDRYVVRFANSEGTGCTVHVRYTLHGPDGSTMPATAWQGDATDNADKALPKALTAAKKSYLVHTFLLSTGVDPDGGGEVSTRPAAAAPPGPPAPDKPASSAQVRRAFAIAANGEPVIPQDHVRLLAHLLTRTHAEPAGRSIHDLTMGEIRGVFAAMERIRSGPEGAAYYAERLGRMAAFLDRERAVPESDVPQGTPGHAPPAPVDEEPDREPEPEELGYPPGNESADPFGASSDDDIPF